MNPIDRELMELEPDGCDRPNGHFSKNPVYIVCSYVKFSGIEEEAGQGCYFKQRLYYYLVLIFFLFYYCLNLAFK